jgi:dihydroorotase/N-acyl-D-amino-acid deacylase
MALKLPLTLTFIFMLVSLNPTKPMLQGDRYDVLIKNGRIVDGSGRPGYLADVTIKGDRIARIGNLTNATASRVIDARGLVVAPGFIDMLGQSETYLLVDPRAMSKVMMGVTTEVTGEGESIAPINERQIKEQEDFLRRFNLTIDWRTLDEYFKRIERQRIGVNLATFVGATQVREYVIGYDDRPPTAAELEQMKKLVAGAMLDGALGLSSSLQYVPARFAETSELVELAKIARQYGGIYATHQRSEANTIDASLNEVFEIALKAKIPVEIWHLKTAYKKNWGRMAHVLTRIQQARDHGMDVTADIYPYIAGSTSLSACLPPWALGKAINGIACGSITSAEKAFISQPRPNGPQDSRCALCNPHFASRSRVHSLARFIFREPVRRGPMTSVK